MNCVIIYYSKTGNTRKVAFTVKEALESLGAGVSLLTVEEAGDIDFFAYDLVCIGTPSYSWRPPEPMDKLLNGKFARYRKEKRVLLGAPKLPGKYALIFCTYSGPHTGINEAIPVGKYVGQFFEHLGFTVLDELYVLSEFHGSEENSTRGRMGNIKGLPSAEDLEKVRVKVRELCEGLAGKTPEASLQPDKNTPH
jgi:flavorubredoxin